MTKYDTNEYLNKVNKYWNAANYLSACQLYLLDNPLLKRNLKSETLDYINSANFCIIKDV